jgi:hypothetical protein
MTSITLVTTAFHDDSEKAKAAAEQINRMLHGKALTNSSRLKSLTKMQTIGSKV